MRLLKQEYNGDETAGSGRFHNFGRRGASAGRTGRGKGEGKRLFGDGAIPVNFRLVDTQLNTTSVVLQVYERAGRLKYGEVEVGQETAIFD